MTDETEESGSRVLSFLRALFVRNFHLKSIALLLTLALYLWVGEDRETQVIATAPIQISVPEDQILLKPNIDKVKVTLRGRWSSLNRFDQEEMKPVVVPLSKSDDGELVPITPESVQIPPGLRVVSIEPSFIRVEMENRVDKEVDIKPRIVGHTRGSYEIGEVRVNPEKLTVSGPESVTATMESIPTEAIDVTGRVRTFKKRVQLRPDSRLISYELNSPVTVTVPIRAEEIQREIDKVTVHPVNTTYETAITPSKLDLTVRGPRSLVQNLDRSTLHAIVDLSKEEEREPGTFEKKVEIRNLPADLQIVRMQPTHFLVTTKPPESGGGEDGEPEVETDDGG